MSLCSTALVCQLRWKVVHAHRCHAVVASSQANVAPQSPLFHVVAAGSTWEGGGAQGPPAGRPVCPGLPQRCCPAPELHVSRCQRRASQITIPRVGAYLLGVQARLPLGALPLRLHSNSTRARCSMSVRSRHATEGAGPVHIHPTDMVRSAPLWTDAPVMLCMCAPPIPRHSPYSNAE